MPALAAFTGEQSSVFFATASAGGQLYDERTAALKAELARLRPPDSSSE